MFILLENFFPFILFRKIYFNKISILAIKLSYLPNVILKLRNIDGKVSKFIRLEKNFPRTRWLFVNDFESSNGSKNLLSNITDTIIDKQPHFFHLNFLLVKKLCPIAS